MTIWIDDVRQPPNDSDYICAKLHLISNDAVTVNIDFL